MSNSIGLIESKGLVALVEAADVISKNSPVKILGVHKLVNGLVTLAVSGNTDYVNAAIESGAEAGRRVGEIYSFSVVDNPNEVLLEIFSELFPANTNIKAAVDKKLDVQIITEDKILDEDFNKNISEIVKVKTEFKREKSKPLQVTKISPIHKIKKNKTQPNIEAPKKEDKSFTKDNIPKKVEEAATEIDEPIENILDENKSAKPLSTIERLRIEALGLENEKTKLKEVSSSTKKKKEKVKNEIKPKENKGKTEIDFEAISKMNVHKLRHYARAFSDFPIKGREISRANRTELVELFNDLKIN
ncbi:MAG TPA: BMC domain-containing protein [Ignavibacteriaceae bacterium]|nr:BMC domain-containing protein [Ignavibacteriaceae bacterium]